MDTLARWMRGTKPELKELGGHRFNRARSSVVERNVDVLLDGGF